MKTFFSTAAYATLLLGTTLTFYSCSNKDDDAETAGISGTVTENGSPVGGVNIYLDDDLSAETDGEGAYLIANLMPGTYVVAPQQDGYTFSPAELSVSLTASGLIGIDFERIPASQITHGGATWDLFNSTAYSVKENNSNTLQLDLEQNALWYNDSEGGAVFQLVQGDFTLSATVNAVKKSNNNQAVACDVCLGGIMARNPDDAGGENYVHLVTGFTPAGLGYETKNTVNNVSDFTPVEDGESAHDLRIVREGSTFSLYKMASSDSDWVLITTHDRPDLPQALQVGLNIYTAQSGAVADLSVIYSDVSLEAN